MRTLLRRILIIGTGLLLLAIIVSAVEYRSRSNLGQLIVTVNPIGVEKARYITKEDVRKIIAKRYFGEGVENVETLLQKKQLGQLNLEDLENVLDKHPLISNSDVYVDARNNIKIEIDQRQPILRIIDDKGKHFYIDKKGQIMPISKYASARVPIANGNIQRRDRRKVRVPLGSTDTLFNTIDSLLVLANYMSEDSFLNAQIDQIYVDSKQEFMLVPKLGRHKIIFGSLNKMKDKFLRLKIFYKKALRYPKKGWRKYKRLNLKYDKQVVGIK